MSKTKTKKLANMVKVKILSNGKRKTEIMYISKAMKKDVEKLGEFIREGLKPVHEYLGQNYFAFMPGYLSKDLAIKLGIPKEEAERGNFIIGGNCVFFENKMKSYLLSYEEVAKAM